MKIVVNDANILFDLIDVDLLGAFFQLAYDMNITDAVKDEFDDDYYREIEPYIKKGFLRLHSFDQKTTEKVGMLKKGVSATLSFPDCTCVYLAQTISATILTGDKPLRTTANRLKIPVHGILWIFDQLIKNKIINKNDAFSKLSLLMTINQRLPKAECNLRLKLWKKR